MPIHRVHADGVTTLTIDRPERRNALNLTSLEELHSYVLHADQDGTRALIITGAGGHFCAGADLAELEDASFTRRLAQVSQHLAAVPYVTIAAIEGSCMGLGMQLAVASDLRVVAGSARFALPVAKLGLMVDHWTLLRVSRLFGQGAARQMILTADVLTADDAWRLGFAQYQGGLALAQEVAARATTLAPLAQAGSKHGFDAHEGQVDQVARYEQAFDKAWASDDLLEGRAAFRERRTPTFVGR